MSYRILLLSHHERTLRGGAPLADLALAEGLGQLGHQVEPMFYGDVLPRCVKATWRQAVYPWAAALVALRRHLRSPYDVVESTAGDAWVLRLLLRLLRRPRPFFSIRTHGLEHRRAEVDQNRLQALGRRPGAGTRLYHFRYRLWEVRRDLLSADAIFFLNSEDAQYATAHLGVDDRRVRVLPNGLPAPFLRRSAPPLSADRLHRLLFIGSWSPNKGADLLPRLVRHLFPRDPRFHLTCAGTQSDTARVLTDFDPADRSRVSVLPRYDDRQLLALLDGHGVLVLPSLAEGCSLAMLEAMAAGLVVLTTPTGYARDLVESGRNGLLIPPGDPEVWAAAALRVAADPELGRRLGDDARRSVHDHGWPQLAAERSRAWTQLREGRE